MAQSYVRNHIVTKAYLRGFCDNDGRIGVWNRTGKRFAASPNSVGYRKWFFGDDEALRAEVEQKLSAVEHRLPGIRDDMIAGRFPQHSTPDRGLLLEFLAIHVVRNPAWRRLIEDLVERQIVVRGHDAREWEAFREVIRSDRYRVGTMLRQIHEIASILGSLHWTPIRVPEKWLCTCDQPVVVFPRLQEGARARVDQQTALLDTVEFRFVLDPQHALIMSWLDAPEDHRWRDVSLAVAADLNRSVMGRADADVFHYLGLKPPTVAPPFLPTNECRSIASALHLGYSMDAAATSERRARTAKIVLRMIEEQGPPRIETVTALPTT